MDIRLQNRDRSPLGPDTILRFQRINRGKDPSPNFRYEVRRDGSLFLIRHSGADGDWRVPFDRRFPGTPERRLSLQELERLGRALEEAKFFDQKPYQADPTVEDGAFTVVTAREGGRVQEVVYEGLQPTLVQVLEQVAAGPPRAGGLAAAWRWLKGKATDEE